ncbi:MAG: cytochrome P450 [Pseudomonadota bacterium]
MAAQLKQHRQGPDVLSKAFKSDPGPTLQRLVEAGPLVELKIPIVGQMTFATTHSAVSELLKTDEGFCTDPKHAGRSAIVGIQWWMPRSFRLLAKNMLTTDDPDHRRLRGLVDQAFHARAVSALEQRVVDRTDQLLDELQNDPGHDIVRHLARPLPLRVICDLLGLPEDDQDKFMRWMEPVSQFGGIMQLWRMLSSVGKLTNYLRETFEDRRRAPRDDMISALVNGDYEGQRLTDDELLSMVFILFVAGHETTTHLISNGVVSLLKHPDALAKFKAHPVQFGPGMVDEVLRFDSPVQMSKPRMARQDLEFQGRAFKRGSTLMGMLHSANWDPAVFEHPERFDITRKPNRHLAFGAGPHFCLGAGLARLEGRVAMTRLFERFPDLKLSDGFENIAWTTRPGLRAISQLPLTLGPEGPAR